MNFDSKPPQQRIDAESNKFPAGIPLLRYGWLSHEKRPEHIEQFCLTDNNVPLVCLRTSTGSPHILQLLNSCISLDSYTMYVGSD
jgi:hypothetical protein